MIDYSALRKKGVYRCLIDESQWQSRYWELMYRRYLDLPAYLEIKPEVLEHFKEWMWKQVQVNIETRSTKAQIAVSRIYLNKLRSELKELCNHIKRIDEERLSKLRTIRMKKDPVNQGMEEAVELLAPEETKPKLSIITGGKGGNGNWLSKLKVGAIFLCKKKGNDEYLCYQFVMDWKGKRGALLSSNLPVKAEIPVDMLSFSITHELVEEQREGYDLEE